MNAYHAFVISGAIYYGGWFVAAIGFGVSRAYKALKAS